MMKFIKWKTLIITCIVCLLPILLGVALWDNLPDTVPVHFNIYNEPDNFASKGFAVFAMPALMAILQIFCCFVNDINAKKFGEREKFEKVTKWIIPVITVLLQILTLGYGMGWNTDIRKCVALIVGGIFLVIGNYLPKLDYIKNYNVDTEKARKINRFIGFGNVIMGLLSIVTIFLPPVATVIWLFLLIVYAVISVIYGVRVGRND